MCVDCVLASPRIAQVDLDDKPLLEVVLSQLVSEQTWGNTLVKSSWLGWFIHFLQVHWLSLEW
jgi:hypothetical protein